MNKTDKAAIDKLIQRSKGSKKRMLQSLKTAQSRLDTTLLTPAERAGKSAYELASVANEVSRIADRFPNSKINETLKRIAFDLEIVRSDLYQIKADNDDLQSTLNQ